MKVLKPGEGTGVHTHYHNYLFYAAQGSTLEMQDEHGRKLAEFTLDAGETLGFELKDSWLNAVNQPNVAPLPDTHQTYYRGTVAYKESLIELKKN